MENLFFIIDCAVCNEINLLYYNIHKIFTNNNLCMNLRIFPIVFGAVYIGVNLRCESIRL